MPRVLPEPADARCGVPWAGCTASPSSREGSTGQGLQIEFPGVPAVAPQGNNLTTAAQVTAKAWVPSPAWRRGLRVRHCCSCSIVLTQERQDKGHRCLAGVLGDASLKPLGSLGERGGLGRRCEAAWGSGAEQLPGGGQAGWDTAPPPPPGCLGPTKRVELRIWCGRGRPQGAGSPKMPASSSGLLGRDPSAEGSLLPPRDLVSVHLRGALGACQNPKEEPCCWHPWAHLPPSGRRATHAHHF